MIDRSTEAGIRSFNRIVQGLIVAVAFVCTNAFACSEIPTDPPWDGYPSDLERDFAKADHVVLAKLRSVTAVDVADDDLDVYGYPFYLKGTYEVIEVFKGSAKSRIVYSAPFGIGNCALILQAGAEYVFFINEPHRFIDFPSGSQIIRYLDKPEKNADEVIRRLGELRDRGNSDSKAVVPATH